MLNKKIFKAYDVRGVYPEDIDEAGAKRVAQAYAVFLKSQLKPSEGKNLTVAVGRDVRLSSPFLQAAVIEGLTETGIDVVDIGMGPTELVYFAVGSLKLDGGIQVSASHNPSEYNGFKMIKARVEAISSDTGLKEIRDLALSEQKIEPVAKGQYRQEDLTTKYLDYIAELADLKELPQLKIVANNNFGATGPLAAKLLTKLDLKQIEIIPLNFESDGNFPKGRPDPLVLENRAEVSELVRKNKADLAVAWDADGDRCYLADESGQFIEGCHLTAILAEHLLKKKPGEKIIYDPRNIWAVEETVKQAGGQAVLNKAGHTFIKNRMKSEQALFAGEMSGHFYFHDFFNADNGLLPFIYFLEIIKEKGLPVSQIVAPWRDKYFVSGEVNFQVADIPAALATIKTKYPDGRVDETDGLSLTFDKWRFNLRGSNTEPLLRLNVEAKDGQLCQEKLEELTSLIGRLH